MEKSFSLGNRIYAAIIAGMMIFSTVLDHIKAEHRYDLYKIDILWPPTVCLFSTCETPIRDDFRLGSLIPRYNGDVRVPSYNESEECNTAVIPAPPNAVNETSLARILDRLNRYWPNLKFINNIEENIAFWQEQWINHGSCFNHPDSPIHYFAVALSIFSEPQYDILRILLDADFKLGGLYWPKQIGNVISNKLGARVQIRCSVSRRGGTYHLYGVMICFSKSHALLSCRHQFSNCFSPYRQIRIPNPW